MNSHESQSRPAKCVVVLGPTATGKTALGVHLARRFDGEIISADSRQVYRGLDIGSGKDLEEYSRGGPEVKYHCIDIVEPAEEYNLFRYKSDALRAIHGCIARGKLPIIVGGTPLYINALLEDYDLEGGPPDPKLRKDVQDLSDEELLERLQEIAPDVYERTDKTQRKRIIRALEIAATRDTDTTDNSQAQPPPFRFLPDHLLIGPYFPRPVIHKRIEERLDSRINAGLLDEAANLHKHGISWQRLEDLGLEYRYAARHLQGQLSRPEFREQLFTKIRRFCKAQEIWFRKMEREGKTIYWIPNGDPQKAEKVVSLFLADSPLPPPEIQVKDIRYGPSGRKC